MIYCASTLAGIYKSCIDPVFIVQKDIIQAIHSASVRTTTYGLFQELGFLKLDEVLSYVTVTYAYGSLNIPQ